MERHSSNALKVVDWLEKHEKVAWVNYPGLPSHAGEKFIDSLKLIALVVHVADARSCVLHPASTTHRQMSEAEQIASGIKPELIRFSVGIENVEDLIDDLQQALDQVE